MSLTRQLAEFAVRLKPEDIPADVRTKMTLHLLDSIGCALAGAGTDLSQRVLASAVAEYANGPCTVIGTDRALSASGAAFVNSAFMNALDHDDGFEVDGRGMGHPGATLVAASLSGIAMTRPDGASVLAALAAAYEINARVILSIQPGYERFRQVYGVCQHQSLGASVAYGRLMGLGTDDLVNALGFAGTLAPLPSLRKYNWDARPLVSFKDFNAPATEAGVRAVGFARAGLIGAADVLDGPSGFWRMIGSDQFDPAILVDDLGQTWWSRNASFKAYPTCRWMHTALESFQTLCADHGLSVDDIEAVEVRTSVGLARDFMDYAPPTMVDAQFSFPFAIANLALNRPQPDWYAGNALTDPLILSVARRVVAVVDDEIDGLMSGEKRRPAGQVRIRTAGRWLEGPRIDYPLGTNERPMDQAALIAKFRANAAVALPAGAVNALEQAILGLEQLDDATAILAAA